MGTPTAGQTESPDRGAIDSWTLAPGRVLDLSRPRVMTILNVTPDSFSDGGELGSVEAVAEAAGRAVGDGADLLDIGGESTRPGAERVGAAEQIRRTAPAIDAIRSAGITAPITIDTTLAEVARAALDAGADAVNDVSGGTEDPELLSLVAERRCGVVLMHRLAPPDADSYSDRYRTPPGYGGDVVAHVRAALGERLEAARAAGIDGSRVLLDPGLGFGKTVEQNVELVRRSAELLTLGRPLLSGASRKSFTGRLAAGPGGDVPGPDGRLGPSIAFTVMHMLSGARVFRVHDTREQAAALRAAWALGAGD